MIVTGIKGTIMFNFEPETWRIIAGLGLVLLVGLSIYSNISQNLPTKPHTWDDDDDI